MLRRLLFAFLMLSVQALEAQQMVDLPEHALHADSLAFDLRVLCGPEMAGRGTGQPGFEKAAAFVNNRLKSWGWKAIPGVEGQEEYPFYVPVPYYREHLKGASFSSGKAKFNYRKDFFVFANGWNGLIEANEMVVLGYGKEQPNGSIAFDVQAAKGKWVVALPGSLSSSGTWQPSFWREAYRQLANAGAAGIILCEPQFEGEAKSTLARLDEERITLNKLQEGKTEARSTPTIVMRPKAFEKLVKSMGLKYGQITSNAKGNGFEPIKRQVELRLDIKREQQAFEAPNVAAYLPGTDITDEWVIVSAHLDHLGTHDGKVYQGADDNGSGSTALLALARQMGTWYQDGLYPRRNIVLVWFSGEENGLLGSRYFAENLPMSADQVVANVNVDMIGRFDDKHDDPAVKYLYVIGADRISQDLHDWNEAVNEACCNLELDYTFNATDDPNRYYFRSDHYNFAKQGIPSMFFFSGVHKDYHKPGDTVDKIDFGRMTYITELILYTSWHLANTPERPSKK